jgi:hypothetical protein
MTQTAQFENTARRFGGHRPTLSYCKLSATTTLARCAVTRRKFGAIQTIHVLTSILAFCCTRCSWTTPARSAEREFREAIRCGPNDAHSHFNLGQLLFTKECKDPDGAEREFREKIRCSPDHTRAHFNLAVILEDMREDYDGAAHELREAIWCDPSHARAPAALQTVLLRAKAARAASASELRVGLGVVLVGLASATFNGARAPSRAAARTAGGA